MKQIKLLLAAFSMAVMISCGNQQETPASAEDTNTAAAGGQEAVQDEVSAKDVVKVAISSKEHTTLVSAIRQAGLVTSLSNAGPFTVFAPTNAAFGKLPPGTVDGLMKDDKKEDLQNILQYHVTVSALKAESFSDGQTLGMVNGENITVSVKNGKVMLNNSAAITASIPASNGIIHVIDGVLLPSAGK